VTTMWSRYLRRGKLERPPNKEMKLREPAMVRRLRPFSFQCSAALSAYEALMAGTQDCRTAGGNPGWQRQQ
jgi:hypothetical protein